MSSDKWKTPVIIMKTQYSTAGREKLTSFCWDVPYLPITTSTEPNNSSEMKLLVLVTNKSTGLITALLLSKYVL
jgi:hypothetical protein